LQTAAAAPRRSILGISFWIVCLMIMAGSFWLRYGPIADARPGETFFRADSAFHYRISLMQIQRGEISGTDPLFIRNPPRRLDMIYPPNLYILAAGAYHLAQRFDPALLPVDRFFLLFNSICALLFLLSCGWLLWEVSGGERWVTLLGLALCSVATPIVLRSHAEVLRHETLGVGLLLVFACLLLRWDRRKGNWWSSASLCLAFFLCVFLGTGFWRLFPALAGLFVLGAVLCEILMERSAGLFPVAASASIACLAAWLGYEFYRQQGFSTVPAFLPLLAAPLVYLGLQSSFVRALLGRVSPSARMRWVVLGILLAALVGLCLLPVTQVRLVSALTPGPIPLANTSLYGLLVEELMPMPLSRLLTADFLLYLPFLYLFPVVFRPRKETVSFSYRFAGIMLLILGLLSLLFVRFIYLSFPFLAAHLVCAVAHSASNRKWRWRFLPPWANVSVLVSLALFLPAIGLYLQSDAALLRTLYQGDPDLIAACHWLRQHTAPGDGVVAEWSHGFEVQTYAGTRTPMDGFLEDETNRRRILEFLRVLFSDREEELLQFTQRLDSRFLFLDRVYFVSTAERLNMPWRSWLVIRSEGSRTRLTLKDEGKRINYIRCLFWTRALKHFQVVLVSGNYVILEIKKANPEVRLN
jgi:hypothetical protein